jgi:hypothetical protein
MRDKLLFEDEQLTFSRRYFWAYQTLGLISESIKSLMDAYTDSFNDEVWKGTHKIIWPLIDSHSARNEFWKHRMQSIKKSFEKEITKLGGIWEMCDDRRKEVRTLRDQLYAGTSVLESRRMVEQSALIVQQAQNVKVFALVTIVFLPLKFVAVSSNEEGISSTQ